MNFDPLAEFLHTNHKIFHADIKRILQRNQVQQNFKIIAHRKRLLKGGKIDKPVNDRSIKRVVKVQVI